MKALIAVALLAGPGHWHPTSVKPQCLAMSASAVDAALCLSGQRFAVVKPSAFLMPSIVATYFSGGSIGPTILPSATAPAATNAYVNYDGTNVVVNAPTGKGFSFNVNGTAQATVSSAGLVGGAGFQNSAVSNNITWVGGGLISGNGGAAKAIKITGAEADGSTAIGVVLNNSTTLSTAGAKLLSVQNNGTEKLFVLFNGNITSATGGNWDLTSSGGLRLIGQTAGTPNLEVRNVNSNASNIDGQVDVSHIAGGSGAPTSPTAGTGCGTSSLATNAGSDSFGKMGVTCGTAGTTTNPYVTITFAHAYNTAPYCTISPANAATEGGLVSSDEIPVTTTTTLAINCGGGTCITGTLLWNYHCGQ
jgi:hypothetical protein